VAAARRERPDICLLDVRMPGGGIRATIEIVSAVPDTTVVIYTVSQTDADLFDALRAGASGYLLKYTDPARLPIALQGVLRGEAALPRTLVARLIEEFRQRERRRRLPLRGRRGVDLTSREWEVLELMRQGLTTAQMAERLYVSQVTIRTHISSILRKLGVPDRAAAIRLLKER
jgi:DNA-binding NarL/FixJ family response regulator